MAIDPPALRTPPAAAPVATVDVPAQPRWSSAVLLAEQREALIDHRGEQYRLRLTAAGKLILTK